LTLSCELATTAAEADRLRPEWTELLERSERNELTLAPEWLLTWQRVYGSQQGRQLRIALFRDSGRLIGLAPLSLRRHWYRGVVPFRRLEFLASGEREGHGVCSNHLNVIAERGAEEAVARRLVVALTDGTFGAWDEAVLPMMDGDGHVSIGSKVGEVNLSTAPNLLELQPRQAVFFDGSLELILWGG
jgi:CelD/BcsL family acetyltransferase involved in cellulose biosynthesis